MQGNYIYIRSNEACDMHNAYKFGGTRNIVDSECEHITMEITRGYYVKIILVNEELHSIMKLLRKYFNKLGLHIHGNTSGSFYNKHINDEIIPYLEKKDIAYRILSKDEVNNIMDISMNHHNKYGIVDI